MCIEVIIVKMLFLFVGVIDVLVGEFFCCISYYFLENLGNVIVCYVIVNNLFVIGVLKEDKECISEIFQEIWESVDDWFINE